MPLAIAQNGMEGRGEVGGRTLGGRASGLDSLGKRESEEVTFSLTSQGCVYVFI